MFKVGYIDEEEPQRNSFYQFLKDDFEIKLFDIEEDTEAENLVNDIFNSALDILVLDFRLDENGLVNFNADSLIELIQERNLYYPLVILTSHELDALDHIKNANLINGKAEMLGEKVEVFKQKLRKIAGDYKIELTNNEEELSLLEKKRESAGLDSAEEDRYVYLNNYFDKLSNSKGHLSRTFYSHDTNAKLDELIKKTTEMLNKIPNKE